MVRNKWTQLPIPNDVIDTVHQLAAACRKYKGIVFTDKDINIIDDHNDPEKDNLEITGVDGNTNNDITGVKGNNTSTETHDITGVTGINEEINNNTGIYKTDKKLTSIITQTQKDRMRILKLTRISKVSKMMTCLLNRNHRITYTQQ